MSNVLDLDAIAERLMAPPVRHSQGGGVCETHDDEEPSRPRAALEDPPELSPQAAQLLDQGDSKLTPERLFSKLIGSLCYAGWSVEHIVDVLVYGDTEGRPYGAIEQITERQPDGSRFRVTERKIRQEVEHKSHWRSEWARRIDEHAMQTIVSWRLGGAAGGTALRVYFGLLALAEQAAWHEFTTSLRRIAEAAGVGGAHALRGSDTKPVRRALARLAADGARLNLLSSAR